MAMEKRTPFILSPGPQAPTSGAPHSPQGTRSPEKVQGGAAGAEPMVLEGRSRHALESCCIPGTESLAVPVPPRVCAGIQAATPKGLVFSCSEARLFAHARPGPGSVLVHITLSQDRTPETEERRLCPPIYLTPGRPFSKTHIPQCGP